MTGPFQVRLHRDITDDLSSLPRNIARRILAAIEERLSVAPQEYGERLRKSLHGYWKLRVVDYRVVYDIVGRQVRVYGVMDRREVYDRIISRLQGWKDEAGD